MQREDEDISICYDIFSFSQQKGAEHEGSPSCFLWSQASEGTTCTDRFWWKRPQMQDKKKEDEQLSA